MTPKEYRSEDWRRGRLGGADLHRCTLIACDLRDAHLANAILRGAVLRGCDLRGACLEGADLTGATYDTSTRWPEGFDPRAHGARVDE